MRSLRPQSTSDTKLPAGHLPVHLGIWHGHLVVDYCRIRGGSRSLVGRLAYLRDAGLVKRIPRVPDAQPQNPCGAKDNRESDQEAVSSFGVEEGRVLVCPGRHKCIAT